MRTDPDKGSESKIKERNDTEIFNKIKSRSRKVIIWQPPETPVST